MFTEEQFWEWFKTWIIEQPNQQSVLVAMAQWKGEKFFRWSNRKDMLIFLSELLTDPE